MKINDIYESITGSGSIASVIKPMTTQSRNGVGKGIYGNEPKDSMFKGKSTNKKYANSKINESFDTKQKVIDYFVKKGKTAAQGASAWERGWRGPKSKTSNTPVANKPRVDHMAKYDLDEAKLKEDDVIIVPGQGHRLKSGFIPHDKDRTDHEVEMARSDLFQAAKNAKTVYELIADVSEEEGLEGWVQEKIIKANDYLNTIREYLEGKQLQSEMTGGVIAGGGVGESKKDMIDLTPHLDNLEKAMNSMIAQGDREDKYPSYRRKMIDKRYELEKAGFPKGGIKKAPGLTKTVKPSGAGNFEEAVDPIAKRITVKKWGGDDKYSWAVLVDGRPAVTGLGKSEVPYYKNMIMKKLQAKPHLTGTNLEEEGKGLWANIHAKRERIKKGSGERMRKPGSKGAPSAQDFKDAANEGAMITKPVRGEKPFKPSMDRPKGEWDPIHGKAPRKGTLAYDSWKQKVAADLKEAQSMGTALKNTLAKAEPGSKLDNSIKSHNRHIKAGLPGTLKNAPTGYHFDSKGYCRLGDK